MTPAERQAFEKLRLDYADALEGLLTLHERVVALTDENQKYRDENKKLSLAMVHASNAYKNLRKAKVTTGTTKNTTTGTTKKKGTYARNRPVKRAIIAEANAILRNAGFPPEQLFPLPSPDGVNTSLG